jgi:biotin-(acetyl-CoA carboxylase) ligase
MTALAFPPLMSGEAVTGADDPFQIACLRSMQGCDAGLVVYNLGASTVSAALVFAPEVALETAMSRLPLCGVGFQNALGALAPPEVSVHLDWDGGIIINGAACGRFRVMASDADPKAVPDWLVIGFDLPLWPTSDRPGDTPDQTALYAEGCTDVQAPELVEAWARHTLNWIKRWEDEGVKPLHTAWRGLASGVGDPIDCSARTGTFLGVDEAFGMLLRDADATHLIPLTTLLETS